MKRRHRMLGLFVSLAFLTYAWNLTMEVQDLTRKLNRLERATRNYVDRDTNNQIELIRTIQQSMR